MSLITILAILTGQPFYTSGVQASQVASSCEKTTENTAINLCTGYTLGVFDAMSQANQICSDRGASIEQIVAVGKKAFADHPEDWGKPPSWILGRSFKTAFPCAPASN